MDRLVTETKGSTQQYIELDRQLEAWLDDPKLTTRVPLFQEVIVGDVRGVRLSIPC